MVDNQWLEWRWGSLFLDWWFCQKSASGNACYEEVSGRRHVPVVLLADTHLCNVRENVPRQGSLYFCLCSFGICYRWHGSDQGWRSRNTPHRWVSFLVLVPGALPGTDWLWAWDFSKFLKLVCQAHMTKDPISC